MGNVLYKITNSNIRKKFSSLEELEKHVQNKKVLPNDMSDTLNIEKITTENIKLTVNTPKLSKAGAIKFLEKFKDLAQRTDYLKIDPDSISFLIESFYDDNSFKKDILSKFIWDKIQDMGLTEDYLKSKDNWHREDGKYVKFKEIFLEYIEYIINNIDIFFNSDRIEWQKIMTDYKPCNAHGMLMCFKGYRNIYVLIRESDVLISTNSIYGRNVYSRGCRFLSDDDI